MNQFTKNQTAKDLSKETPLMRQYWEIKSAHADKLLFFRMGDFYELFFDDAVVAAPILGIALTSRNKKAQDETPMCGLPHHAVAGPVNKLLSQGYKVAICDQIEDPKLAKGIVRRAVTRVLTPGMVYDNTTLDAETSHYIAAIAKNSLAFSDASTGECFFYEHKDSQTLERLVFALPVAELVVLDSEFEKYRDKRWSLLISGHTPKTGETSAVDLLKSYIFSLGGDEALRVLRPFEKREFVSRFEVSPTSLRHLEVYYTYKGEVKGSLYSAINRTQTAPGARLLKQWLAFPLKDFKQIQKRQHSVKIWTEHLHELKTLRQMLSSMGDIERRLSRLATPQCSARDLIALGQSTQMALQAWSISERIQGVHSKLNPQDLHKLHVQAERMAMTFRDDAPLSPKQGHMIQKGVSRDLDELIELSENSQGLLSQMEAREREQTGISSLKIRYNNVFGYYIEITNTHKEKVPKHYQRKQTLANAERYCTEELVELERKVLSAQTRRFEVEFSIFDEIRNENLALAQAYLSISLAVAELDVLSALAWLAIEQKYICPEFNTEGRLEIRGSRHPVVEQQIREPFIANNILLAPHGTMLLTGPNMAGKSTLMRQVAVTSLLAQMGSFVPAESASLPIFDRLFTRIGASDQLSEGLSTFMVEMQETAELLRDCTSESLVVLDEVGRGTSTFDGLALAQSILEYIATNTKPLTFFATHFHELTDLEGHLPGVLNFHMSVSEDKGDVKFLHTLIKGPALKSYGIYVAELAGLPSGVTRRAKGLLKSIESKKMRSSSQMSLLDSVDLREPQIEGPDVPINREREELLNDIKSVSLTQTTPLEALNKIANWQQRLN